MKGNLSYRYKLPLGIILASFATAITAVMLVSLQYYHDGKNVLVSHSQELGYSMLNMLAWSIRNDDVWHAYSLLRGPEENALKTPKRTFIVVDRENKIFASNAPNKFSIGTDLSRPVNEAAEIDHALSQVLASSGTQNLTTSQYTISSIPIQSDDILIGKLIISENFNAISALFHKVSMQGLALVALLIGITAPIGWYWGNNMSKPLVYLESCMSRVGKEPLDNIQCRRQNDRDEVGILSQRFQQMLNDLKEKSELEQQVIVSDRLAAIGTLSASVAHEINNPLSGMIIAVDTYQQHYNPGNCPQCETARDTISLVERGLFQIKDITMALLMNIKDSDKAFKPVDIDDVYRLIAPEIKKMEANIAWESNVQTPVNTPSTMIRQVLFNLLLNAVHAIDKGGNIHCCISLEGGFLYITVKNDGKAIKQENIAHIFEPYHSREKNGSGLGLWVTHKIIQKLSGTITASRQAQLTVFDVKIPAAKNGEFNNYGNAIT